MLKEERLERIVALVEEQEVVLNDEIVKALGISIATVRRDINDLAQLGKIEKVRGGAVSNNRRQNIEPSYKAKSLMNIDEKRRIGMYAASLVENGEQIVLDSGSTCMEVANYLQSKRNLGIVTNDLLIAMRFATNTNNNCLMFAGGTLRHDYYATYGSFCEDMLSKIHAKRTFIAADAVDVQHGLISYTPDDIRVKQLLMKSGKEVILVCDHTKFELTAYIFVESLDCVDKIITGKELRADILQQLRDMGKTVILV